MKTDKDEKEKYRREEGLRKSVLTIHGGTGYERSRYKKKTKRKRGERRGKRKYLSKEKEEGEEVIIKKK